MLRGDAPGDAAAVRARPGRHAGPIGEPGERAGAARRARPARRRGACRVARRRRHVPRARAAGRLPDRPAARRRGRPRHGDGARDRAACCAELGIDASWRRETPGAVDQRRARRRSWKQDLRVRRARAPARRDSRLRAERRGRAGRIRSDRSVRAGRGAHDVDRRGARRPADSAAAARARVARRERAGTRARTFRSFPTIESPRRVGSRTIEMSEGITRMIGA